MDTMRDENGRLFPSHRAGKRLHRGTLDDYANMGARRPGAFEGDRRAPLRRRGQDAGRRARRHFADPDAGGYFITADDAADLIVRNKHCHRQRRARRQRHPGRRFRPPLGADGRRVLARQGPAVRSRPSPASWKAISFR